jgi:hypothetical protein
MCAVCGAKKLSAKRNLPGCGGKILGGATSQRPQFGQVVHGTCKEV